MSRSVLLIGLIVGILVDVFFALANLYPVTLPHGRSPRRYVVADLDATQAAWFQQNMLDEFNAEHGTNIRLRLVPEEQMIDALHASRRDGHDVLLAALPQARAMDALRVGAVAPFDAVVAPNQITRDLVSLRPELLHDSRAQGRQYFLPRAVVLDVAVYRRSKVRDALVHWRLLRAEIDAALREANGHGLPAHYDLEQAPTVWDAYDQFVLAYYWSHRSYHGAPARARVAHRTGPSIDAQLDLTAAVYRAGGSDATLSQTDAQPLNDYFGWEILYQKQGVYASEMFDHDGLDDEGILRGLADGRFFLATVDEMEAFTLHGGGHRGARAQVQDEEDFGFVAIPRFVSLEQSRHGAASRTAAGFAFRELVLWALPANGTDPRTAYDLVRWISSFDNHVRECEALGGLPMRTDVLEQQGTLFRVPWVNDIFNSSLVQWPRSQLVPAVLTDQGLGVALAQRWNRVVGSRSAAQTARPPTVSPEVPAQPATTTDTVSEDSDSAAGGEFRLTPLRDRVILQGIVSSSSSTSGRTDSTGGQR